MRGARDAWVVVADRLLAKVSELFVADVERALDDTAKVFFDRPLILRGGRDDLRVEDRAFVVE